MASLASGSFPLLCRVSTGLLALAIGALPANAQALAAAESRAFLGEWRLTMEIQGNPVEMTLRVADEDGAAVAYLSSPRAAAPQKIIDLTRDGESLVFAWQRDLGGQTGDLHLALHPTTDGLAGDFGDASGSFSAQVTGARATRADARSSPPRRSNSGRAQLRLEPGLIEVGFEPLDRERNTRDFAALESLSAGDVFAFTGGRAIKLTSEPSLRFGEVTVAAGNASPNYPGVYSLWLQRTTGGWSLLFNQHADIWGTQREAEADVVSVPLVHAMTDADEPKMDVSLAGAGNAGSITIAWGAHRWSADFTAVP
jgi:hypothetical protein